MDVRSYRKTDCNSVHFLMRIKFKPKISVFVIRSGKKLEGYDITKLNQTSVSLKYREEINKLLEENPGACSGTVG
jgi:hypothetical protein